MPPRWMWAMLSVPKTSPSRTLTQVTMVTDGSLFAQPRLMRLPGGLSDDIGVACGRNGGIAPKATPANPLPERRSEFR